ncbi:MAG TPA: prepilin-type N-terminal cleavage/methylation domain-containing protein [Nitrospiria bacterium]
MSFPLIQKQAGSSLIEVLVCMVILAIGMIGGLGMTQAGQTGLEAGRRISAATGFAQAMMEEKVSMSYSDLVRGDLEGREDLDGFVRTWTILPDTPGAHRLTIRVAMEWPDHTGRLHRLELATLRSKGVAP